MTFKVARKLNETFTLDARFELALANGAKIEDPMCKGYIYANLYFFDEVEKELGKLRALVKKVHDEVVLELGMDPDNVDTTKLLLEVSVRVRNVIGEDSLDAMIKELLAEKTRHIALMIDEQEHEKLSQISEAIFMELTAVFFTMTLQNARELEGGIKTVKFTKEYVDAMTDRQKKLLSPAIKLIGFENQVKLNNFELSPDWTIKYKPERLGAPFQKQEETLKEQIKTFIQQNS